MRERVCSLQSNHSTVFRRTHNHTLLSHLILPNSISKSKSHYDWWSVSQCIVVSSPLWDLWPDIASCQKVAVLFLWGALSDERSGLSFCQCQPVVICQNVHLIFTPHEFHTVQWCIWNIYKVSIITSNADFRFLSEKQFTDCQLYFLS
jgi:hypothetical protein